MTEKMLRGPVLIVGAGRREQESLSGQFAASGIDVLTAGDGNAGAGLTLLKKPRAIVVADHVSLSDLDLLLWAARTKASTCDAPVFVIGKAREDVSQELNTVSEERLQVVYLNRPLDLAELTGLVSSLI